MFIGVLSILVVGWLAQASSGLQLPEQYIGWPLRKGAIERGSLDHELIEGLALSANSSPEMVKNRLKAMMEKDEWGNFSIYETAESFLELDDGQSHCSYKLAKEFLTKYQAYKTTKQTEAHPEVMLNFLEHYGRKKFPACAREAIAAIQSHGYHERPAKFFRLALSLNQRASDSKFYDELKKFKPLESVINVDNLAPVCPRQIAGEPAAERIKRKFDTMCYMVKDDSKVPLNILNLANHFAPDEKFFERNPKIGAMNEMRRACFELEEKNTLLAHLEAFCTPKHDSMSISKKGL